MVATMTRDTVAAGAKFLEPVVSVLKKTLNSPDDLQAGTLNNPTAEALATFLVTVIRADGGHVSPTDINAYLKSLCQNANTSFEDQLIGKAAQIAFDELNPENTTTLSPAAIANEVARIAHGTENAANNIMRFNLAAIQAQR
jgi:hypothetical protein